MAITKTYSMKPDVVEELEKYAKERNLKMSVIVDAALRVHLKMNNKGDKK